MRISHLSNIRNSGLVVTFANPQVDAAVARVRSAAK